MNNKGLLFIPDMSGVTRFVNETEIIDYYIPNPIAEIFFVWYKEGEDRKDVEKISSKFRQGCQRDPYP